MVQGEAMKKPDCKKVTVGTLSAVRSNDGTVKKHNVKPCGCHSFYIDGPFWPVPCRNLCDKHRVSDDKRR